MSEILFKSKCFVENCKNETIIYWHHANCSPSSDEYLNDNGYIRCSECGMRWPLLKTKFNCSTHSNYNAISNTSLRKALNVVSSMMMCNETIPGFFWKLSENLKEQVKNGV